ncbi:hypothetical protein [Hymenobacter coccineus]|uniref:DoxX family protein n=1 Tax=Hymenobacter coccineus TaxID=1908235 RepID=A0A1G1TJ12_9BACT|nr:hypothetical protein [Hymenobacter coccineus]OGX90865.1 hypothetical protein BEN49_05940 [Hymenobacter coccineus]
MKIISGLLLLASIGLTARHGWAGVTGHVSPAAEKILGGLGIAPPILVGLSWLNLLVAGLVFFPATFFAGNLLNAATILLLIAYALRAGNLPTALVEMPFLLLPLALIWLKHPLAR